MLVVVWLPPKAKHLFFDRLIAWTFRPLITRGTDISPAHYCLNHGLQKKKWPRPAENGINE